VAVDQPACRALLEHPEVNELAIQQDLEHSIEVQLPFLQTVLEDFSLIPLLVGDCRGPVLTEILSSLWGGPETLLVISTGLSRNRSYREVIAQDQHSAERIRAFDTGFVGQEACGFNALNGFLPLAQAQGLASRQVALTTSADLNGQKEQVRGFGAFVFY
jgi:AmmeMemoRadiSam system protein B